jgi:hypothetical protein
VSWRRLRAINADVILRELVEPMRRAGAGDPTLLQVLAVLQAIFAYAVTTDRLTHNAVRRVTKPRQPGGRRCLRFRQPRSSGCARGLAPRTR